MYYHGTQYGGGRLKPSILMNDRDLGFYGGGGYGERYWGISVSKDKEISSRFSIGRDVRILPVVLCKNAKVVEIPGVSDAADIDEHIEQLWADGVDAVWIGKGEQELCVLNPAAIVNIDTPDSYRMYMLGSEENPLRIIDKEGIAKLYDDAKAFASIEEPRKPEKPMRFEIGEDGMKDKPKEVYEKEMQEYEKAMDEYLHSDALKEWQQAKAYAQQHIRFSRRTKDKAISLPRSEYATLTLAINTNQKSKIGQVNGAFTANNYYLYTHHGDGDFTVTTQIPIDGNEDLIGFIQQNINNGTIKRPGDIALVIKGKWHGDNKYNSSYALGQGRPGGHGRPNPLDVLQSPDGTGSDGQLGEGLYDGTPSDRVPTAEEEAKLRKGLQATSDVFRKDEVEGMNSVREILSEMDTAYMVDAFRHHVEHDIPKSWPKENPEAFAEIMAASEQRKEEILNGTSQPNALKHSRRGTPNIQPEAVAQALYEQSTSGIKHYLDEAWHDDLVSVRKLQEALAKARGVPLKDLENVYWHAVTLSSVNAAEMEQVMDKHIMPLIDTVREIAEKHGLTQQQIEEYLNCKQGLERNELMATRDAYKKMEKDKDTLARLIEMCIDGNDPSGIRFVRNELKAMASSIAFNLMRTPLRNGRLRTKAQAKLEAYSEAVIETDRLNQTSSLPSVHFHCYSSTTQRKIYTFA